ncbi:AAA family ATPase [Nonomuraea sp. MCN248]|uniref:AAA family ATPase n=1 Tax=Nonomuraea corallina TaxID=2989783 RepID=A0ABT4S3X5_9ACTN|nr:AAA family ATPase [Nonomuraea corallina]MDA0631903.1 AAA family ATPase [Nonomuraea corallina]
MTIAFDEFQANPNDYLPPAPHARSQRTGSVTRNASTTDSAQELAEVDGDEVDRVIQHIAAKGFVFQPWQIAAFITAVRTKPFVILAGISGTGKTKLPALVAEATEAHCDIVPVRPDWNDSSELLGYERLDGSFQPGALLRTAKLAMDEPESQFFFVLDEMNIARVEYYLAEVLSKLETRQPGPDGRIQSGPLVPALHGSQHSNWAGVCLPDNLCIVGSVNMDETTFGFSKKVLDRAFVIEFSDIDLSAIRPVADEAVEKKKWLSSQWRPTALSLSGHPSCGSEEVSFTIEVLTEVNEILKQAQLQFGYRVRDEIAMFCLAAKDYVDSFVTNDAGTVSPLDVAIAMKVLPRIQGSGATIRMVLEELSRWASPAAEDTESQLEGISGASNQYPFCSDRLELMRRRLDEVGFTNFWL